VVCFSRIWSVPCEAWRTGSLRSHHPRASARRVASSKLRSAVADRGTSDRPVPPNQPVYLHPRSWLSSYLSIRWLRPSRDGARDTTFHDVVARFRRTVEASPVVRRGSFVRSSFWHPCRSPVSVTPPLQATVIPSCEPRPPSPELREETERVDDPGVPSSGRTLGLPSALSIPMRALRRACDPVYVHEAVRPAIDSSSRAPWASTLRCGSGGAHPRPSPRLPACCNERSERRCLKTGFSGLLDCLPISATHIDARARPRAVNPSPREAPASVRVRGHPDLRQEPDPPCEGSVTSFTRYGCFHPTRALLVWCGGKPPSGTGTTGIRVRS